MMSAVIHCNIFYRTPILFLTFPGSYLRRIVLLCVSRYLHILIFIYSLTCLKKYFHRCEDICFGITSAIKLIILFYLMLALPNEKSESRYRIPVGFVVFCYMHIPLRQGIHLFALSTSYGLNKACLDI